MLGAFQNHARLRFPTPSISTYKAQYVHSQGATFSLPRRHASAFFQRPSFIFAFNETPSRTGPAGGAPDAAAAGQIPHGGPGVRRTDPLLDLLLHERGEMLSCRVTCRDTPQRCAWYHNRRTDSSRCCCVEIMVSSSQAERRPKNISTTRVMIVCFPLMAVSSAPIEPKMVQIFAKKSGVYELQYSVGKNTYGRVVGRLRNTPRPSTSPSYRTRSGFVLMSAVCVVHARRPIFFGFT